MSTADELYAELKPDIEAVADPAIEASQLLLRRRGNFLPHGVVLTEQGEVQLVAAAPDTGRDLVTSAELLPVLHEGLRRRNRDLPLRAIAVAENVTVTPMGERPTQAIKVLVEHRRGLTVAMYLPFRKRRLLGYTFGEMFATPATPEVKAWTGPDAGPSGA